MADLTAFKSLYVEFANAMLAAALAKVAGGEPACELYEQFVVTNDGWTIEKISRTRGRELLPWLAASDFPRGEAERCAKEFVAQQIRTFEFSNNAGERIPTPAFDVLFPHVFAEILMPLLHTVETLDTLQPTTTQLEQVLSEYIEAWQGKRVDWPMFAPLFDLLLEGEAPTLENGISLEPLSLRERADMLQIWGRRDSGINPTELADASLKFVFKPSVVVPGAEQAHRQLTASKALRTFITALRLVKTGNLGTTGYAQIGGLKGPISGSRSPLDDFEGKKHWFHVEPYRLQPQDRLEVEALYRALSANGFRIWQELETSLILFNRLCQRVRPEDRILDHAICMESTLLHGLKDELKYRLSIRAAMLLRGHPNAKRVTEVLKKLYDVRSLIVHENAAFHSKNVTKKLQESWPNTADFLDELDATTRQILKALIGRMSDGASVGSICDALEASILDAIVTPVVVPPAGS